MIEVEVFGKSDAGQKRRDNQDNMLIADLTNAANGGYSLLGHTANGTAAGSFPVGPKGVVLLVADGMGGAAGGATASRLAVTHIIEQLVSTWSTAAQVMPETFSEHLMHAVYQANAHVHEAAQSDPQFQGMGTTVTLAGLLGDTAYFAQVGDSRAYIIRDGAARQVTRDQSVVQQMVDAGVMSEDDAERSEHANKILQALGTSPVVQPVLTSEQIQSGDVILVCSDGLTRVMRKPEIADVVSAGAAAQQLCEQLVEIANDRGAPDNVTVVAARIK